MSQKKSRAIKIAMIALSFGLIAASPAFAVDLQGSGASFPANLIEGCKAGYAASGNKDRKSTRLNSSHMSESRMPSSA